MLRLLVLLLLLANGVFFGWSQGWFDTLTGTRAQGEREPERLARQVRPESVRLLPPAAASAAIAAADAARAPSCLEAGPFAPADVSAAEQALATLPPGSWTRVSTERPGRWLVYMGRFADREALERKVDEVRRRNVEFDEVRDAPEYEPGLSFGSFDSRAAADAALERLVNRGVRTARVVAVSPPVPEHRLRVDKAEPALRAKVLALQAPALGAGFRACGEAR